MNASEANSVCTDASCALLRYEEGRLALIRLRSHEQVFVSMGSSSLKVFRKRVLFGWVLPRTVLSADLTSMRLPQCPPLTRSILSSMLVGVVMLIATTAGSIGELESTCAGGFSQIIAWFLYVPYLTLQMLDNPKLAAECARYPQEERNLFMMAFAAFILSLVKTAIRSKASEAQVSHELSKVLSTFEPLPWYHSDMFEKLLPCVEDSLPHMLESKGHTGVPVSFVDINIAVMRAGANISLPSFDPEFQSYCIDVIRIISDGISLWQASSAAAGVGSRTQRGLLP